jgi:DNA-binding NarL/FixJ family response regulator
MRILIADDSAPLRERLVEIVRGRPEWEVVGEAQNVSETLAAARRLKPDAVVLDLEMPGGSGLEALPVIKREQPATFVIILTNHDYPQYRKACAQRGADFFLAKANEGAKLIEVLQSLSARLSISPA